MASEVFKSCFRGLLWLQVLILLWSCGLSSAQQSSTPVSTLGRSSFPPNFIFGAALSAYQSEGAASVDGKGPSIWDTFTRQYPNKIADHTTAEVADDFYHRYKEDIKIMKSLGLDAFRLSISWPRVIPTGKLSDGENKAGIDFYNKVIDEILANGMKPFVTLFHWDLPQGLEDEYQGFLSLRIVDDFVDYAELCFKEFGDRVKDWSTFNEPWSYCQSGYDFGSFAPGRCSEWRNNDCPAGNSGTEPYIAAHNLLIAHGEAVELYRTKYKPHQKGQIGIVLNVGWFYPYSRRRADITAAKRALDFMYGWFLDPLVYGDYPKTMRVFVGERLPNFSPKQSEVVKGSLDYLGINYYTSLYAQNTTFNVGPNISYTTDSEANETPFRDGVPIGEPTGVPIFFVVPRGLGELLNYTKDHYKNPLIYIMENGMGRSNITTVKEGVNDTQRVRFYRSHLSALKVAIDGGVNVMGFFAWSFLDTWEWTSGFAQRFGLVYVDYDNGLKRYPKRSAHYYKRFLSS